MKNLEYLNEDGDSNANIDNINREVELEDKNTYNAASRTSAQTMMGSQREGKKPGLDPSEIKIKFDDGVKDGANKGIEFEKRTCFGETCFLIRRFFNWSGAVITTIATALDFAYAFRAPFYA